MAELNGSAVSVEDLQVLALTNFGHFTSIRVEEGGVRGLELHMARLKRDSQLLFGVSPNEDSIREYIRRMVGKTGIHTVRVTVFDPNLELGTPGKKAEPHVLVTTRAAANIPLPPLSVQSVSYVREMPAIKHVALFGTLWHRRAAQLNRFDDALFVDAQSVISEGATWNIGFFDGDNVIWPNVDVLEGVTMDLLKGTHKRTVSSQVRLSDLQRMEAAFATNAAIGVRAIKLIDDVAFPGGHPIIDTLREEYSDILPDPL
ncbi:aminotransferase class IV family protein [Nonomuraea sp. B1E8]|uniref:aminotransferase class IV family protein n=1 Tax=unclassified Nonomuraea TaxID=2593643 RepID=UPI00325F1B13